MRPVWKGMVLGALAGAAVGLVLEALRSISDGASRAAQEARAQAPGLASDVAGLADRASKTVRGSGIAERATSAVQRLGEQIKSH
jgi:hypothetical protein